MAFFDWAEGQGAAAGPRPDLVLFEEEGPRAWRYAGQRVPSWTRARALAALDAFNENAGRQIGAFKASGRPTDALTRITGAVLAYPKVDEAGWRKVVEATFADPWWDDTPSVGVVFGPNVVEKNVTNALSEDLPEGVARLPVSRVQRKQNEMRAQLQQLHADAEGWS